MKLFAPTALLLAAGLALTTLPAQAQFGGGMGGMRGMGGPGGSRGPGGEDGMDGGPRRPVSASGAHLIADLEQQLDNVRYQLRLRPAQEPAWTAYQEKVGALVADQLRPGRQETRDQAGALQQIDRKVDVVRNRLAALEDIAEAARKLYGTLDDKQKAQADRLLAATVPALYSGSAPNAPGQDRPGPGRPARPE